MNFDLIYTMNKLWPNYANLPLIIQICITFDLSYTDDQPSTSKQHHKIPVASAPMVLGKQIQVTVATKFNGDYLVVKEGAVKKQTGTKKIPNTETTKEDNSDTG